MYICMIVMSVVVNVCSIIPRAAKNSDFVRVVGFCAVLAGTRTDILPTSVAFGFR